jgi:uncharacterized protein (DUF4415 family)
MSDDTFIRRYSAEELRAKLARGESRTDHEYLRNLSEEDLERSIADDPDWKDVPADWYKDAVLVVPTSKKLLSLRLDKDVVEWFRATGPGYQTRMNAALRAYMLARQKADAK